MNMKPDEVVLCPQGSRNVSFTPLERWPPARLTWFHRSIAMALLASFSSNVFAQTEVAAGLHSPTYSLTDANGVNLTSNKPSARVDDVSIGAATNPLGHSITTSYESSVPTIAFTDSYGGRIQTAYNYDPSDKCISAGTNGYLDVMIGGGADRMCGTLGGSFISQRGTGSFMFTNADGTLTYTKSDGTQFQFNSGFRLTQSINPDGRITTLTYKSTTMGPSTQYRVQSVTRNDGLQLKYTYVSNATPVNMASPWFQIASIRAINTAVEYCDPLADSCTFTQIWPESTYTRTTSGSLKYFTVTDAGGRATRFTTGIPVLSGGVYGPHGVAQFTTDQLLAVRAPTSTSADTVAYTYCAPLGEYHCMKGGAKKVNANGVEWTYSGTSGVGGVSVFIQLTSTRPGGSTKVVQQQVGNYAQGPLISYSDNIALRSYQFESSLANRLRDVNLPDGNKLTYVYDSRGNVTQETHTPKSGSSLDPLVKSANYDTTCSTPVKCNKPNWVRDAKNNQTDYEYDPIHGGVLKITSPPDAAGVRPQVRQTFAPRYAWYKNASGTIVQAPSPIWVLTTKKNCRSTAALPDGSGCTSASDEVTTTFEYGPTSGANNLFLRGVAVTADGVTLRTCYGYDIYGNRISETLPKAGLTSCP